MIEAEPWMLERAARYPEEYYANGLRRDFWEVMRLRSRTDDFAGRDAKRLLSQRAAHLDQQRRQAARGQATHLSPSLESPQP